MTVSTPLYRAVLYRGDDELDRSIGWTVAQSYLGLSDYPELRPGDHIVVYDGPGSDAQIVQTEEWTGSEWYLVG